MPIPQYPLSVLLTGATGFVGGTALSAFLERPDYLAGNVRLTVLVRGEARAAVLREKIGVEVLVADLADVDVVRAAAREADVILHTANADHPPSARAMLEGLKERYEKTGVQSVFIHSSGTGALTDNAKGQFASEKIYQDEDCTDIRAIPTSYVHRETDNMIMQASIDGYVRGYVVMPPLIYGRGTGLFSRTSVQIPALIRAALKLRQSIHVGPGLPLWNGVHVQDLVRLYFVLLDDALSRTPKAPTGSDCFYFCATDTYQWRELAGEIGRRLHAKGAIPTAEPRTLQPEEVQMALGEWSDFAYGSNSRSVAGKALSIGWTPAHPVGGTGLFDSIEAEYEAVLEEGADEKPKVHNDETDRAVGA
ncbi:hypothetical protein MIND_00571100 [Mycena indigotica]|uniref:NAD-dependent epimerase/dehydratase domain-containing protein n=1 Tax=Mycena indigotica TaxID=2126181 RepID=A0A8H6SP50_9AGAR|nr:uncharacterized protein MIND_00571100 [Mycena indigotica]KAF7303425.1 hypothetical protein MIND_00571100 [Mycena indigotica]